MYIYKCHYLIGICNCISQPTMISVMLLQACRSKTPPNVDQIRSYLEQTICDINLKDEVINIMMTSGLINSFLTNSSNGPR